MKLGITQYSGDETDWAQLKFCLWKDNRTTFLRLDKIDNWNHMNLETDIYELGIYVSFVWRSV